MIDVYVATHKKIQISLPPFCKMMQVNSLVNGPWDGYLHDSDGKENISKKNASYCELTVLYSLWKNSGADIKGLFHYRRYLGREDISQYKQYNSIYTPSKELNKKIINETDINRYLEKADIILPSCNEPYPNNALEDLHKFCYDKDIQIMLSIIQSEYPDYYPSLIKIMNSKHISYCNMFIGKKEIVDEYCNWLFDVLGKIEYATDIKNYDKQHKRIYGYLSEVLLNVYMQKNNVRIQYVQMIQLDESTGIQAAVRTIQRYINSIITLFGLFPIMKNRKKTKENVDEYLRIKI